MSQPLARTGGSRYLLDGSSEWAARRQPWFSVWLFIVTGFVISMTALSAFVLQPGSALEILLSPDREARLPGIYSGLLLLVGAVFAWSLGSTARIYRLFGVGLASLAIDESLSVHERLEALTGIDWQILYGPVILVGGLVLVLLVRRMISDRREAVPWLAAGIVSWGVSQVLEMLQWDGDVKRPGYTLMMFAEESLEMLGTVAIIVALVIVRARNLSGRETRPSG